MIIYKDILTGDEIISDTYDLQDVNDIAYEVNCKMITQGGLEVNIGANASEDPDAAHEEDGIEDTPKQVNDVIDGFRLNQMPPFNSKEDFAESLKVYLKNLTKKLTADGVNPAKIKTITDGVKSHAKKMSKTYKDFEPYVGESFDVERAMPLYLNYREDGETPYFTIWKYGLSEMKV